MKFTSPEDEKAFDTMAGEATTPRPTAAEVLRKERRLTPCPFEILSLIKRLPSGHCLPSRPWAA